MPRKSKYPKCNLSVSDRLLERVLTLLTRYYGLQPSMGVDCEILKEALMLVVERSKTIGTNFKRNPK